VPNAASVVITENTSLIRKLIDLKADGNRQTILAGATRFITVKYADVTGDDLNELLDPATFEYGRESSAPR
jgi:hypothetical protein